MDQGYLDFQVIGRIDNMQMLAKVVVEGFVLGLHRSPFRGFSVEFAEHRQYSPGDEIKHIDWKVFGKTDRYYIKQFEEETNLACYIVVDASASMAYKSKEGGFSKLQYASYMGKDALPIFWTSRNEFSRRCSISGSRGMTSWCSM